MAKFFRWLAGILATVIAGLVIWYIERPVPTTTFEGMVIDGPAVAPLPNAIVSVEITGATTSGPFHDVTNEHGAYRLDFTGLGKLSGVTIKVEAKGYQTVTPALLTSVGPDNRKDFELMRVATVNPPPPGGDTGGRLPPAIAIHKPVYIQKPVANLFKFAIQAKP